MSNKYNDDEDQSSSEIPFSWFLVTLRKYVPYYVELVFLAIFLRLIGLVEPFIFQVIIDRILPFQREASLVVVVAVFILVIVFQIAFGVVSQLLGMITANRVTSEFGRRIYQHLFRLPFSKFRRWTVGETIARISETDTIRNFMVGTSMGIFLDALFVVIYLFVLFSLSPALTWIVLAALPLQGLIYLVFGRELRTRLRNQFDTGAKLQTQMVENIAAVPAIKALGLEKQTVEKLSVALDENIHAGYRIGKLGLWSDNLVGLIDHWVTISIIFFGSSFVFAGDMTLGSLIAFFLLAENAIEPIQNFSGLWESWQNIRVSRQRLGEIVNTETETVDELPTLLESLPAHIGFDNVTFAYEDTKFILKNFSFEATPLTLSLIVGPSGVGKSTFGRLASGIERPTTGTVAYSGKDISGFDPQNVRHTIAYVPQEHYLFTGTIRENLSLLDANASESDMWEALSLVGGKAFVKELYNKLDSHIGERGAALSGGQKQRLSIARSLMGKPKILVLDEPTSALDKSSQQEFATEIAALKETMTIIIITHNPSVFYSVDQVVDFGS